MDARQDERERRVNAVLGHVAYFQLKLGRPYTDFTLLVDLLAKAGVHVGDLNHCQKFIPKWASTCSEIVKQRLQNFFKTPLPQTGRLPHVKVTTEKATYKHRPRMVSGLITVVPNSPQLIQGFMINCGVSSCGVSSLELLLTDILFTVELVPSWDSS